MSVVSSHYQWSSSGDYNSNKTRLDVGREHQNQSKLPDEKVASHTTSMTQDDQVTFIILARNNSKPDPYGAQSTTQGPLPWRLVAEKYNDMFGTNIGSAAVEKRARHSRDAWLTAHPHYPRNIVYTQRIEQSRKHGPSPMDDSGRAHQDVATWKPSYGIRNNTALDKRTRTAPVLENEECRWAFIEVVNNREELLQVFRISASSACISSALLRREVNKRLQVKIVMMAPTPAAVALYLRCIDPKPLSVLSSAGASNQLIPWDATSLIHLYAVAAQLEDSQIKNLIRDRWSQLLGQEIPYEMELADLNYLFHSTEADDEARIFWTSVIHAEGIAQEVIDSCDCHPELKGRL